MEKVITTKRGVYGRVQVTLPLHIKSSLMDFQKKSGIKKAEFLRLALVTGYIALYKGIEKSHSNLFFDSSFTLITSYS